MCLLFIRGLGFGNFGRLSDSLADLREGMRLSELNHERYWLPRLPNTLGWLHSEMFDTEEALRLNRQGSAIAREMKFPEGDANSQINLAFNHLSLGEPDNALGHLSSAGALLAQDEWFRWVYTIRLHAAYAEYWLAKQDRKRPRRQQRHLWSLRRLHAGGNMWLGQVNCSAMLQTYRTIHWRLSSGIRQVFPNCRDTPVRRSNGRFCLRSPELMLS